MRNITLKAVGLLIAVAAVVASTNSVQAQSHNLRLQPELRPVHHVPKLGIYSQFIYGRGVHVTGTVYGSEARRLGIEAHDDIIAVDGVRLTHAGSFQNAVHQAMHGGGNIMMHSSSHSGSHGMRPAYQYVTLHIRDWRTGRIQTRVTNLANWN